MAPKSHAAKRDVQQWVAWAASEGFTDITVTDHEGNTFPGVVSQRIRLLKVRCFAPGKVYCTLCAKFLVPSSTSLKQHCNGYYYRSGGDGEKKFFETEHCRKVKLRDAKASQQPQPVQQSQAPIVIQVHRIFFCIYPVSFLAQLQAPLDSPKKRENDGEEPSPKRPARATMESFLLKGSKQEEFCRDVVKAFSSGNIPMSKLAQGAAIHCCMLQCVLFRKYFEMFV
eukprot:EG_transcript_15176